IAIALALVGVVAVGIVWGQSSRSRDQHGSRAEGFIRAQDYPQAIEAYTRAIQSDPNCALAYANRASAYFSNGDFERTIDDCNHALELDPKLALAYSNRGGAYLNLNDLERT